ncbi:DUF542 domain-containing protein [Sulfidibacter corallicola]|uniref:DUF542 domain-containing protein n=1 Tax=Sulfidibacter corallicola TaxID=2818388 RepID=A0A8A4TQP8_SULCO|nr:DUF542 domain-containing protein [Sulfidibacter corallicola]QTD51328.1 DUF542 domain-containing protein [Sulfidibacter corallicola]
MPITSQRPDITAQSRLGDCVAHYPALANWCLQNHLDFCCGGGRTLEAVAADREMTPQSLVEAMTAAVETTESRQGETLPRFGDDQAMELIEFILTRFHEVHRNQLDGLGTLSEKVARVHGEGHPEVLRIRQIVIEMTDELTSHMAKEEMVLFPLMHRMMGEVPGSRGPGMLGMDPRMPMQCMRREHDEAGDMIAEARKITNQFQPPADACTSFRALYALLEELERDLMLHIHLENNVLFPIFEKLADAAS